jgi:predicted DNA-binding WGR domain protein|tara:strand:+ start:1115 stop:1345 length:231 start_codon:yes stop_codon:yes gene_type:complete
MIAHLERKQPGRNCFRFYRLEVARDLFGGWVLVRSWGRIGTRGRDRIDRFASAEAARRAQERHCAAKARRGYSAVN